MEKTLTTTQESPGSNQRLQKKKEGKKGTIRKELKKMFCRTKQDPSQHPEKDLFS